jgi:flagellar biosynthesis/type III secretory pathway protein FliH
MALMERIRKDALEPTEFQYIDDYEKFLIQSKIHEDIIRREAKKEAMEEGLKEGVKKGVKKGIKEGVERSKEEVVILSYQQNIPIELIATITNLSIEKVKKVIVKYKKQSQKG